MADSNDQKNNGSENRQTISLKSAVDISPRKGATGNRTVEVEIKRKRSGLTIEADGPDDSGPILPGIDFGQQPSHGNLTDREFKARVKALQEAMKEDEMEEEVSYSEQLPRGNRSGHPEEVDGGPVGEVRTSEANKHQPETVREKPTAAQKPKKQTAEEIVANSSPVVFRMYGDDQKRGSPASNPPSSPSSTPAAASQGVPREKQQQPSPTGGNNRAKPRSGADDDSSNKRGKLSVRSNFTDKKDSGGRRVSRAILDRVLNSEPEGRSRSMASLKRSRMKQKNFGQNNDTTRVVREVSIPDSITIGELANRMAVRSSEVIKYLMSIGTIATVNQKIDGDTAEVLCGEFGHTPKRVSEADVENELLSTVDDPETMEVRPPIIAIMGHVDHGKTTLLDALRNTNVARKEAGGITQGVAAYQITSKSGKKITCIDTPGHAAFSGMRSRGAGLTDIIVLVVAADDGVKDQTIEVIHQAKAYKVPIVVAINKIDKPNINVDRLKSELLAQDVILEDFGGDVLSVEISALHGKNLDGLLDVILLQSEMMELKANKNRKAVGTVLESRIDKGRGIIASVVIQRGTLSSGDIFVAGDSFGKVRIIYDDKGNRIEVAFPSDPIEIVGFNSSSEPGDVLSVLDSEQKAREIAEYRQRVTSGAATKRAVTKSIDQMMSDEGSGVSNLNIFIKADVFGSLEAIVASVDAIQHPEINVQVVDRGVGIISESDVDFAKNTGAIIIGFNTNATVAAKNLAKLYGIKTLHHNIIYRVTEDLKEIMASMLSPIAEEHYIGTADVRKIFSISRIGTIAGCCVVDGTVKRGDSKIKVMRGGKCIFEGKIKSMKHEKDEIKESKQSHECGILADGFNDFSEGDQIECYEIILKTRSVD
ncbi:MAG: translation initiation factor IF-2 [Holosporales bacterium]|jgi:translation initiation factor IF-2|nr:translation initiation factor IF-2 [Holosporales bacterium]